MIDVLAYRRLSSRASERNSAALAEADRFLEELPVGPKRRRANYAID
ncbi:MAG: hypothetical protein JOY71_03795 [Acetobacteraceae bacterium]|nr:hypothetical protein [Acetobacteraceae bacterium]